MQELHSGHSNIIAGNEIEVVDGRLNPCSELGQSSLDVSASLHGTAR